MLIKHIRDDFGIPVSTLVAVNRDMIGVAVCSPKDHFNRKRGIHIAKERAYLRTPPEFENDLPNRWIYKDGRFKKLGEVVLAEVEQMKIRSRKYYWK